MRKDKIGSSLDLEKKLALELKVAEVEEKYPEKSYSLPARRPRKYHLDQAKRRSICSGASRALLSVLSLLTSANRQTNGLFCASGSISMV
jgi:hypothetical protein